MALHHKESCFNFPRHAGRVRLSIGDASTKTHHHTDLMLSRLLLIFDLFFDLHLYFLSLLFVPCPDSSRDYHHEFGHSRIILEYFFLRVCVV